MRELNQHEVGAVSGGIFGLLGLFSSFFCKPKLSFCAPKTPAPTPTPPGQGDSPSPPHR